VVVEPENRKDALELVERLDPAIGEATSMVGAMLTELLRRTLRGGVLRIGDEMHGYVSEKLDTVIAERTPALEQLAADVAEHAARTAATEVATEEVHALEKRTQAGDLELAGKITETARAAEQRTKESAEALTAHIQASDLELAGKITEAALAAEQWTKESAETLTTQIKESEQRGQAALDEQVKTLIDRSRERSERLKARFVEQNNRIAGLSKQLGSVSKDLVRMLQENHAELREVLHRLEQERQTLAARVAELEKPRGLRALWLRLFGRRKAKSVAPAAP
jgi:chromosome segregation ATPase